MMPLPTEWDLTILFDGFDDPRFEQDFARAEELAAELRGSGYGREIRNTAEVSLRAIRPRTEDR